MTRVQRSHAQRYSLCTGIAAALSLLLAVPAPGQQPQATSLPRASQSTQAAPQRRVPRQMPAASALQGRVLDRDGRPVPGLTVSLAPGSMTALTDADGIFRLIGVAPGHYTLAVLEGGAAVFPAQKLAIGASEVVTVQVELGFSLPEGPASAIPHTPAEANASIYRELSRHALNDGTIVPPLETLPTSGQLYAAMPDRWNIQMPDGRTPNAPVYKRYGGDARSEYVMGHWYDPFNRNVLKGDYPIFGQQTFFTFTGESITALDGRRLPTPSSNYPAGPGEELFFGKGGQFFLAQTFRLSFQLAHGDAAFRPIDWQIRVTPVANINYLKARENGVVNVNPAAGTSRVDGWVGVQEAFFEKKLKDLGPNYDFVSVRAGIQQFASDFRGFIFADEQPGVRLFGNLRSNRLQYNAAFFDLLEKNTNSELNTFHRRCRQVGVANLYIQDFGFKGYTTEFSYDSSYDDATVHYDDNGFLVRPAAIGAVTPHSIRSYYIGWTGDGHIRRVDVDHAFYQALGQDSLNPLTGRKADINAQLGALELSLDEDWMRFRVSGLYASGDAHPHDAKDRIARGFDSIVDNEAFAGGEFSFFNRESIRLTGTGVALNSPDSFLPDLVAEKDEGQSNFVNPGLALVNAGADAKLTTNIKLVANVNYLRFIRTEPLEFLLFQSPIQHGIGVDSSLGAVWRPKLSENLVVKAGAAALAPAKGLREIYQSQTLISAFGTVTYQF
ncbi:MAG TPA: carboxypeptidase-like regulatory domain-containing protein [Acidobacteriaceae bacterium]|nr:carboxypeptidase-like regulatory domain-containing protein [Acidobacteriaceae bacterium]